LLLEILLFAARFTDKPTSPENCITLPVLRIWVELLRDRLTVLDCSYCCQASGAKTQQFSFWRSDLRTSEMRRLFGLSPESSRKNSLS
jgi:hypothetical protein